MRVLLLGCRGQLGRDLDLVCTDAGDEVVGLDLPEFDVGDRDAVHGSVTAVKPDVVLNAAAMTAVDRCETDVDLALRVNTLGVRWLREATEQAGAHLVQISTDYVFSGELDRPYDEWDEPDPRSAYGRSKLGGEAEAGPGATIVRTSWLCGEHGSNMVHTVLRLLEGDSPLRFVEDQRGCPTFTSDLAPMIRRLAVDRRAGVHHVTNAGAVSWYEFVRAIAEAAGHDPGRVEAIATADLDPPRPAPRPANSVLDNAALRLADLPAMRPFEEPLRELVARLTA